MTQSTAAQARERILHCADVRQREAAAIAAPILCRNCGKPVEKIVDPWGFTSYMGREHGWHHTHITNEADGLYGTWCLGIDLLPGSADLLAEPPEVVL